jgi:hypothetical protein
VNKTATSSVLCAGHSMRRFLPGQKLEFVLRNSAGEVGEIGGKPEGISSIRTVSDYPVPNQTRSQTVLSIFLNYPIFIASALIDRRFLIYSFRRFLRKLLRISGQ